MSSHDLGPTEAEEILLRTKEGGQCVTHYAPDGSRIIHVSGAHFAEPLNLTSIPLSTIIMRDCDFETLRLDDSHASRIELQGCTGREVSAKGLMIDGDNGDLILARVMVHGTVDLSRARIGGRLLCRDVTIQGERDSGEKNRAALGCRRVKVGNDVDLDECDVDNIDLVSAEIEGTLTCTGHLGHRDRDTLRCEDQVALRCNGVHVKGHLRLGDPDDESEPKSIEIYGEVCLVEANVEGDVNLTNARIYNADRTALDAEHVIVGEDLYLNERFEAEGLVRLAGARVTGLVNCTNGMFRNEHGPAINADGMEAASVYFNSDGKEEEARREFLAEGGIRLEGARIRREVLCTGARITASKAGSGDARVAISADSIAAESVRLDQGCEVRGGTIRLGEAHVTAGVYCTHGRFEAPKGYPAISAEDAKFGDLVLDGEFVGEISLRGTTVSGQLKCTGGKLHNPQRRALTADRLTCGSLYLNKPFSAEGIVSLWGATVGYLDCREGIVRAGRVRPVPTGIGAYEPYALDLANTEINGHVFGQGVRVEGGLSLADAHISGDLDLTGAIVTPTGYGPEGMVLNGRGLAVSTER